MPSLRAGKTYSVRQPWPDIVYTKGTCPFCGECGASLGHDGEEDCEYRYYIHDKCGAEWTEVYSLGSVYIEKVGERKEVMPNDSSHTDG